MITRSQMEAAARRRAAAAAAEVAVAEYRATRTPKFTIHKPTPEMYGVWFELDEYDLEERTFTRRRAIGVAVLYLLLGAIVVIIGSSLFGGGVNVSTSETAIGYYVIFGSPILVLAYNKAGVEGLLRAIFTLRLSYSDNVLAYRASLAAWEFTNSECGLGYWQALRGTEFEHASAMLFRRRGCDVTTTKGSGDGGIDLILNVGAKTFWCQCKGHAKPVSVAPVREIAGVCVRGQATPVILAVNGFTGPAVAAADELGVTCLDASDLCNLARREAITSLGELVRGFPLRSHG
jgi:HJR/Mrr/RecB family endonuclease